MIFLTAAQSITTPIALVAFALSVGFYAYKAWLGHRRRVIESIPSAERAELVTKTLQLFGVDTAGLSKQQQYQLALEQIRAREDRFRLGAILIAFLAVLLVGVIVFVQRPVLVSLPPSCTS